MGSLKTENESELLRSNKMYQNEPERAMKAQELVQTCLSFYAHPPPPKR